VWLAHTKSGDAATIAGYCGKGDALEEAMSSFAKDYAKQTEQDDAFAKAKRAGRIKAERRVRSPIPHRDKSGNELQVQSPGLLPLSRLPGTDADCFKIKPRLCS
jgi:hypothetical protein